MSGDETAGGFGVRAIHAGESTDVATRSHATPIYQTATFAFESGEEKQAVVDAAMGWEPGAYFYPRTTSAVLERKDASLEGGRLGFGGIVALRLEGGPRKMHAFVNALELFSIAVSLAISRAWRIRCPSATT